MNDSGASFSVATTVFVSLAICAIVSYGVFYYFKQRISVIEQSQMEQARVMQAFISRSIMHQHDTQVNQMMNPMNPMNPTHPVHHKEVNITESGLIEVSSDSESESDESESESTTSESSSDYDNDSGSEESESETKHIQIKLSDAVVADVINDIAVVVADAAGSSEKKIISLNKTALGDASEEDGEESDSDNEGDINKSFELKIGYKNNEAKKTQAQQSIHLNYGNMSVSALRLLAKERGLVSDDNELQKLKKKDLVQLLQ